VLRESDANVNASDSTASLEVGVVPRAEEDPVHPLDQRLLELADLALSALQHTPRLWMGENLVVEHLGDPGKVWLSVGVHRAQRLPVARPEADVVLQVFEDRFGHAPRITRPRWLPATMDSSGQAPNRSICVLVEALRKHCAGPDTAFPGKERPVSCIPPARVGTTS